MLGLYYKEITSYPVGYERIIDMYPLDFEEFLWANGINENIINILKQKFLNKQPIDEYILKQINDFFRMFLIVGGMPEVVNSYIKDKNLSNVMEIQKSIIEGYKFDVVKYAAPTIRQKVLNTFDSIPTQLSRKNKKFSYVNILDNEGNVGERKYSSSIEWLKDAGIINYCYNLSEPAAPLKSNLRLDCFKIYVRDIGLLMSMFESGVQKDIMNDNLYINIYVDELGIEHYPLFMIMFI